MAITIRKSDAQIGNNVRHIAPTLLIGLGGTGKEVLLRVRRRFFERFGATGFPIMSYLWIDTDMRNVDLEGQKYDYLMDRVAFDAAEKLDAQIPGGTFSGYFRDPESHPNIFSWLDPSLRSYGQVLDGAGQKRQFGRLSFFHHFRSIRERLLTMKNTVLDQAAADELVALCRRHSIDIPEVDRTRLDVIFVFSVAGGTGSGMFLDAAFLARHILEPHSPNLAGYVFLPTVYNQDVVSQAGLPIFANGYAALKELEHFSLAKDLLNRPEDQSRPHAAAYESDHHFQVEWTRGDRKSLVGPPFNTCYLIDNQSIGSRQAISPNQKRHLCDMIAEAVFLDFNDGSFAAAKRSTRSNLEQYLLSKVDMDYEEQDGSGKRTLFTEVFSCRFSSLGLTKLYIPADRIRRHSAYRLGVELIDSFLTSPPIPGDVSAQFRKHHLGRMGIEERSLLRALASNADNSDELIQTHIERSIDEQEERWRLALPAAASGRVRTFWRELSEQLRQDSDPGARPGDLLARIELANRQTLGIRLFGRYGTEGGDLWAILNDDPEWTRGGVAPTGEIGRVVRQWLDDPRYRLPLAQQYLKAAKQHFREDVCTQWRKLTEARRSRSDRLKESIDRRITMLEQEEAAGKLIPSKRALLARLRRDLRSWVVAEIEERVFRTGLSFVEEDLLPYLDKLEQFLRQLASDLGAARDLLSERLGAFEAEQGHSIFLEVIDKEILDESFEVRTGEGFQKVEEEVIQRFERELLESVEGRGVADLLRVSASRGINGVAESVEALAFDQFGHLPVRFDILREFRRVFPTNPEAELEQWARRGTIWLPPGDAVGRFPNLDETVMSQVFLGAPEVTSKEERSLLKATNEALSDASPGNTRLQTLQNVTTDSVYVYSEAAGISLPSIRLIDRYLNEAYLSVRRKETVHIDFHEERFPQEIVVREFRDVRRYLDAYRILLIGTITGVLRIRESSAGRLHWSYMDQSQRPPQPTELGSELFAVNTLQQDTQLAQRIDSQLLREMTAMSPDRQQDLYAVLSANLDPTGSFPIRHRRRAARMEKVMSHGRLILEEEMIRLESTLEGSVGADREFLQQVTESRDLESISQTVHWFEPPLRVLKTPVVGEAAVGRA